MVSNYYHTSEFYQKVSKDGLIDDFYEAMRNTEDLSKLVLTALDILKKTNAVPELKVEKKCETYSTAYRNEGNKNYKVGNFVKALGFYNKALLHAPASSQAMELAYSNGSALLFKIKAYSACMEDINTCIKMGCTPDIQEKLMKRKQESIKHMWEVPVLMSVPDDFFRFNVKRNPNIPCASTAVDIVTESGLPRVVAAKDITVATIIAVESLFVSALNPRNQYLSCYYCHKMSLNLIPCHKCCFALFCNQDCKHKSMKESHSIECEIIEVHENICQMTSLVFKAVLKIKQRCKSWSEFFTASRSVGEQRMKRSSLKEIFDSRNKFSLLNFAEKREANFGTMYNYSFVCAALLYYLSTVGSFFPQSPEGRVEAMSAVARVMMRMLLYSCNKLDICNVADDRMNGEIMNLVPNVGNLCFAGKLRHCCEANLQLFGLNNKVAIIAVQPIKKGAELTISYVDHTYEDLSTSLFTTKMRAVQLYRFHQICRCRVCDGTYVSYKGPELSDEQKRRYKDWRRLCDDDCISSAEQLFAETADMLRVLQGMHHTREHHDVYNGFRSALALFQYAMTKNVGPAE